MTKRKEDNRDNFKAKTREKIARRAGYRCSNPACRRPTLIPEISNETETKYIGKAAHISSAASNGPRYGLTKEQRISAENGIHLCGTCHDKIDANDGRDYPIHQLKEWKIIHDEWLRNLQADNNKERQENNKTTSPYFTKETIYHFAPEERSSGYIITPDDNSSIPARFIDVKGRIDKTVSGSTYWVAISPQASFDHWWPQGECILAQENFWMVENAILGRRYPEGHDDSGRRFEIGLYETLPNAHSLFQEAKAKDAPIPKSSSPFESPLVEKGAFLLWKISVTRTV